MSHGVTHRAYFFRFSCPVLCLANFIRYQIILELSFDVVQLWPCPHHRVPCFKHYRMSFPKKHVPRLTSTCLQHITHSICRSSCRNTIDWSTNCALKNSTWSGCPAKNSMWPHVLTAVHCNHRCEKSMQPHKRSLQTCPRCTVSNLESFGQI